MTKIVPAILASSKQDYMSKLKIVRQLTNRFQLDIIDGKFVDNKTIDLDDVGRLIDIRMDIHLMVEDPRSYVKQAVGLNANTIIIQIECSSDLENIVKGIKSSGINVGLAVNPETSLSKLAKYKGMLDHVLIMGYSAGFSGQKFKPECLERLPEVRKMFPGSEIGLDGGVTLKNVKKILESGFDIVNVNSAIFESFDPLSSYSEMLEYTL